MPFVDGGDRVSQIACPVGSVDHMFYCLFVVPIFFHYLIQSQTKLTSYHIMCVIVVKKATHHNICSLSDMHNSISHDKMASMSTLPAKVFFGGRG